MDITPGSPRIPPWQTFALSVLLAFDWFIEYCMLIDITLLRGSDVVTLHSLRRILSPCNINDDLSWLPSCNGPSSITVFLVGLAMLYHLYKTLDLLGTASMHFWVRRSQKWMLVIGFPPLPLDDGFKIVVAHSPRVR